MLNCIVLHAASRMQIVKIAVRSNITPKIRGCQRLFRAVSYTKKRSRDPSRASMCQAPVFRALAAERVRQDTREQLEGMPMTAALTIGGHRGMGENLGATVAGRRTYRENTVSSFRRAASAGAAFVEFDVQVTKDGVPVIWHDDLAVWRTPSGSTRSTLIADLTLSEFKQLSRSNCPCSLSTTPQSSPRGLEGDSPRGPAACYASHSPFPQPQLLRDFPTGPAGEGAAEWVCSVDDELPTLAEVFARVPEHVGFDIEIKMTTPASEECTSPTEVDRIVSAVLGAMLYMGTSSRTLVFSSFDPCVCTALRARQQRIPVLFLSTGGACWHVSPVRTSLDAAIAFALQTGLQGIVVDTSRLRIEQHVVAAACSKGLHVMTYGLENNDSAWVQQQGRLGVAAVITDDVDSIAPLATARNILPATSLRSSSGGIGFKEGFRNLTQAAPSLVSLKLTEGGPLTAALCCVPHA